MNLRKTVEVKMFDVMQQHDCHHGKASERIDHLNAGGLVFQRVFHK
jgi:hypothetical protein